MESPQLIDILRSFDILTQKLNRFSEILRTEHTPSWCDSLLINGAQVPGDDRSRAALLFTQLEYTRNQEPREILVLPGVIAASEHLLNLIDEVNDAKRHFKSTVLAVKQEKLSLKDPDFQKAFEQHLNPRNPGTHAALKKIGMARLHLKQCYRLIPTLPVRPDSISWTWANTRSIQRISVDEAREKLAKRGHDTGIKVQMDKLSSLSPREPLAIVQELAPHLRANIRYPKDADLPRDRQMIKGAVPIFYPYVDGEPLPVLQAPAKKRGKDKARRARDDQCLDPTPFLPAIRAHRYLRVRAET